MKTDWLPVVVVLCCLFLLLGCESQGPAEEEPFFDNDIPPSEDFDAFLGVWGHSGNKIVFNHHEPLEGDPNPGKLDQIWIYDRQTQQRRKIIDGRVLTPNLHPDGQWVVFHTNSIPEFIYKVKTDGTALTRLTGEGTPNDFENTTAARFAPEGDEILFTIFAGTPRGIAIMDTSGANANIIVPIGISGDWFPDGQRIVYVNWDSTVTADRSRQIYTANKNGTNQTKVTNLADSDIISAPDVSPDGTQIAFSHRGEDRRLEIFVMNTDGTNIRQLTQGEGDAGAPDWHPDGTTILFSRRIFRSSGNTIRRLWMVDIQSLEVEPVFPAQ